MCEPIGKVSRPSYSVEFNSVDEAIELGLVVNAPIYFAPPGADCTKVVFSTQLTQLMRSVLLFTYVFSITGDFH